MSAGRPFRCRRGSRRNCSGIRCARRLGGAHAEPAEGNPALLLNSFEARQQNFQKALTSWRAAKVASSQDPGTKPSVRPRQRNQRAGGAPRPSRACSPASRRDRGSKRQGGPAGGITRFTQAGLRSVPCRLVPALDPRPWRARGRSPTSPKPLRRGWPDQQPPASTGSRTAQTTHSPF
jgi:hypothetical protein